MSAVADLTVAEAARIIREVGRGEGYRTETGLGPLVAAYLASKQTEEAAAANTVKTYKTVLRDLALYFGDLEITDFEPPVGSDRLREFLAARYGDLAVKTRGLAHSVLTEFFQYAVISRRLYGNPMSAIRRPKQRGTRRRAMPLEHIRLLIANADTLRERIALLLLLYCGLRREELRLVQFDHFDLTHGELLLVGAKGGGMPVVPLDLAELRLDVEREIQRRLAGPDEFLLYPVKVGRRGHAPDYYLEVIAEYRDRPLSSTAVHNWWKRSLRDAGLSTGWKLHELRHRAITEFIRANAGDLFAGQDFARHRSIQTTFDIYGHLADEDKRASLRRFYDRLEGE